MSARTLTATLALLVASACGADTTQPERRNLDAIAYVAIGSTATEVMLTDSLVLTARAVTEGGAVYAGAIQWRSSDSTTLTVQATSNTTAIVRTKRPNRAFVTASVGSVSSSVSINVIATLTMHAALWVADSVTELPGLPRDYSYAAAINDSGVVVGAARVGGFLRAFRWTAASRVTYLAVLPGMTDAEATSISNAGHIAGWTGSGGDTHAIVRMPDGTMISIGALPGDVSSMALGVNSSGVVVGFSRSGTNVRPFKWTSAGGMVELPVLSKPYGGHAAAIDDEGNIAGSSYDYGYDPYDDVGSIGTIWKSDGAVIRAGACTTDADCLTRVLALSRGLTVVGTSNGKSVLWKATDPSRLVTIADNSYVAGVNRNGVATGYFFMDGPRAFVWDQAAGVRPLSMPPLRHTSSANGINTSGRVVGWVQ